MSHPQPDAADASRDAPVPGRGRRILEIPHQRLKDSWVLRSAAYLAFMGYGGLVALALAGKMELTQAGVLAVLSLASWFFLFWWYPVKEKTLARLEAEPGHQALGWALETFGVGCVVLVHLLMAVIVVYTARR